MIKIDFEKTDGTYTLRDALHLEDDHTFSEQEIEAMMQQRFNNWIAIITAPAPEPVPEEQPPEPIQEAQLTEPTQEEQPPEPEAV